MISSEDSVFDLDQGISAQNRGIEIDKERGLDRLTLVSSIISTLSYTKGGSHMFELTKAAKEQLDMHFAGKEVSPIRVYMAAG